MFPEQPYNNCSIQKDITNDPSNNKKVEPGIIDQSVAGSATSSVLDVTKLEPRRKHPTVFEWFNKLGPGSSFILKNDHDPKPLYYQMLGELGPVFNWEYTEQGPEWWKVVIQKRPTSEQTIGEIAAKDSRKAEAMKRMGIDFCCGGSKTVSQAAVEAGITAADLTDILNEKGPVIASVNNAFDKWDVDFLADYIYNQHHKYFYENKDAILQLVNKVKQVHQQTHPELVQLAEMVDTLFNDLEIHFHKEEKVLFPYIKELAAYKRTGTQPLSQIAMARGPLAMMHMEHEAAGDLLKAIRNLTNDYHVPGDACNSFRQLYSRLKELEADLHQHIHLENNILFPKALLLEKEIMEVKNQK